MSGSGTGPMPIADTSAPPISWPVWSRAGEASLLFDGIVTESGARVPEGHTIHRAARVQAKHFVGKVLTVSSPQGRFDADAARLNGHIIERIDAWGKHLFYRWDHDLVLHVHLGLFGKFRIHTDPPPPPTPGTRLHFGTADGATLYLSGPTDCRIVDEHEQLGIVTALGPDPLRKHASKGAVDEMLRRLERRTVPIAAALLDQTVIAGLGNVYRAEIMFRLGINPFIRARDLDIETVTEIWTESSAQLKAGERSGRIVTTDPIDVGRRRRSEIRAGERLYVYQRRGQPCRRCGTPIERADMKGRKIWWCPICQA